MIALQLGRPSGIADKDIDIEFPLNIDLQVTDPAHIFEMQNRQIEITKDKYPGAEYTKGYDQVNSVRLSQWLRWWQMTSSIHNIRLNQLKQLIQDTIYRLDKNGPQGTTDSQPIPEIEAVLQKLNEWRACRPVQPANVKPLPLLSEEQLGLDYHEVRLRLGELLSCVELTGSVSKCYSGQSSPFGRSQRIMLPYVQNQPQAAARYVASLNSTHFADK
jgi:hypothetical protein